MNSKVRWEIRAASAALAISGVVVISLTWSPVNAFADAMGFGRLNFAEYLVVFALVRLPILLATLGGSLVLLSPKNGFSATASACVLYVLFTVLYWAGETTNFPPGSGLFGIVVTGVSAYLAMTAMQAEESDSAEESASDEPKVDETSADEDA